MSCLNGGRSLSALSSSQIIVNPDLVESHRLRGWYDSVGSNATYSEYRREGDSNMMASGRLHLRNIKLLISDHLFILSLITTAILQHLLFL